MIRIERALQSEFQAIAYEDRSIDSELAPCLAELSSKLLRGTMRIAGVPRWRRASGPSEEWPTRFAAPGRAAVLANAANGSTSTSPTPLSSSLSCYHHSGNIIITFIRKS